MTVSTAMLFGLESDIETKDVGQPKFRLVEVRPEGETVYVLLGSLHMPLEDDDNMEAVEAYVNSPRVKGTLLRLLRTYFQRPISESAAFEYVPRYPLACLSSTGHVRTASR